MIKFNDIKRDVKLRTVKRNFVIVTLGNRGSDIL